MGRAVRDAWGHGVSIGTEAQPWADSVQLDAGRAGFGFASVSL